MTDSVLSSLLQLDGNHEELAGVDVAFFSEMASALEIIDKEGLSSARDFVRDSFLSKVRTLTKGLFKPRFMKDAGRSAMRSAKRAEILSSGGFYLESFLNWTSVPSDFSSYVAGLPEPHEVLDEATDALEGVGCLSLARSIKNGRPCEKKMKGFMRLSIRRASMILAKINGYEPARNGSECILIKRDISHVFRSLALPLHLIGDLAPQGLLTMIDSSDSEGVFDHHIAVVPILGHSDGTTEDARRSIIAGKVNPVVLGERDGICYFVGVFF